MKAARDVRLRALAAGVGLVAAIGITIKFLPEYSTAPVPSTATRAVADGVEWDARRHEAEQRAREIDTIFKQGMLMLHARSYDNAITALHRVLELAPKMPEAHVNMGYALLGKDEHVAARDFFRAAIELRPDQYNAYYGLAETLERDCDWAGALGAMRTFIHLAPPDDQFVRKARAAVWEWESTQSSDADAKDQTQCLRTASKELP